MKTKVLIVSHSSVVDVYQDKLRYLARHKEFEITLLTPTRYFEAGKVREGFNGFGMYTVKKLPTLFGEKGRQHLHVYLSLQKLLADVQPDIIHLEEEPVSMVTSQIMFASGLLKKRPKFVAFTWENINHDYTKRPWYQPQRYLFPRLEKYALSNIDYMIYGSHEGPGVFREKGYSGPGCFIPQYGVDPHTYYADGELPTDLPPAFLQKEEPVVLYVGRMLKMKGIDTLIEAFSKSTHGLLLMVGSGGDQTEFESRLRQQGLKDRVHFTGNVEPTEVPKYLRLADIMVLPSLTTPQWKEQFGRVLIEAMACGTVPLGSSSGEIPTVIGDAGLVFKEGNVDDLLTKMTTLLENAELLSSLREAGIQRVKNKYTNEILAQQIADVYQTVLQQ